MIMTEAFAEFASLFISLAALALIIFFGAILINRLCRQGIREALRDIPTEYLIIILLLLLNMFLA